MRVNWFDFHGVKIVRDLGQIPRSLASVMTIPLSSFAKRIPLSRAMLCSACLTIVDADTCPLCGRTPLISMKLAVIEAAANKFEDSILRMAGLR